MENKILKKTDDRIPHLRTSVYLPRMLYSEAQRKFKKKHTNLNRFVNEKITEFLKQND